FNVVSYPGVAKLGKQLKFGSSIGAKAAVILGPDEIAMNQAAVRNMDTRDQEIIPLDDLSEVIRRILDPD
ncbi:MAG: His/Gly/Thr/Pro-type tRNA ligase C-terminal domain-containing protein, partial [Anaerolineales bacterium]|nr:His/Gly/Thr/Pro-type tRNA ligase C-terminal domain-containing protein [Anaerolineales bacterium]